MLPASWPVVRAFGLSSTQWRQGPGGPTGLDYAGCRAALAGSGLRWRDVRAGIQVMEQEVLAWLAERRAARK